MISRNTVFAAMLLATTGLGLAACERQTAVATGAGNANQSDVEFVTNAYNVIEFDEQEASYTAEKASDPRVRALAAELLAQARDFRSRIKPIAEGMAGIKPPEVLRADLRARLGVLRFNNGVGVDKAFIDDQIASHTDALNAQNAMMAEPGGNPQLQDYSRRGTVALRENLTKLRALQRKMMVEGV